MLQGGTRRRVRVRQRRAVPAGVEATIPWLCHKAISINLPGHSFQCRHAKQAPIES